jgi:splicing suppressor protein 51
MISLKKCSRCESTWYCTRACQKQDWESHKESCKPKAQINTNTDTEATKKKITPEVAAAIFSASTNTLTKEQELEINRIASSNNYAVLDVHIALPFHQLRCNSWLDSRSEKDVFKLLIDSYRLRVFDDRPHCNDYHLHANVQDFGVYLRRAERQGRLLPEWWCDDTGVECLLFASAGEDWSSAVTDITEEEITRYYPEILMVLQMRIFAEQVHGHGPGGESYLATIEFYLIAEQGKLLNFLPG